MHAKVGALVKFRWHAKNLNYINYAAVYKILVIRNSKKQIIHILKIIIFPYKINYVTMLLLFSIYEFGYVKYFKNLD